MHENQMKKSKDVYLGPNIFDTQTEEEDYPKTKISNIPSSFSSDSLSSIYGNKNFSNKYHNTTNMKEKNNNNSYYKEDQSEMRQRRLSIGNGFGDNIPIKGKEVQNNKNTSDNYNNIPRSKSTNFSLSRSYLYNNNENFSSLRYQQQQEYQQQQQELDQYGPFFQGRIPKMMMHNSQFVLEKSLQNVEYNDVDSSYQHSLEAQILGSLIEPRLVDDVALLYKTYSRSLFVANVAVTLSAQEITNLFDKYGELKGIIFDYRKMAHFIIVKYYDLRSARDAYSQLNGCSIHGQKLVIRNCVPIEPETEQTNCFVIVRNIKRDNCSTVSIMKHFKCFGDIKDITDVVFNPGFQNSNFVVHKIIEFYDSRSVDNLFHAYSSFLVHQQPQPQSSNNVNNNNNNLLINSPFTEIFAQFSPKTTPISFERPNYSIIDKLLSPFVISCKKLITYANHSQMHEKKRSDMPYKHYNPIHTINRNSYPHEDDYFEDSSGDFPSEEDNYNPSYMMNTKGNNNRGGHQTMSISSSPSSPLLPFYSSNSKMKKEKPIKPNTPSNMNPTSTLLQPHSTPVKIPTSSSATNLSSVSRNDDDKTITSTSRRKTETVSDPSLYELHLNSVRSGEDKRTTLMIKNIPNKYDQEMLLKAINKTHKQHFDFFYLPIDLKHDCNVGYAFINFISYKSIPAFVERFNKTKWKKFNSEKICEIAYARLQGKQELINHFQNSTRIKYDKKCRPVVFASEGPNKGKEEDFPFNFEDEDSSQTNNNNNNKKKK